MKDLVVTAVEPKASENFLDIAFTFRSFEILQDFNFFSDEFDSFYRQSMTMKFDLFRNNNVLSGAAVRPAF